MKTLFTAIAVLLALVTLPLWLPLGILLALWCRYSEPYGKE